jgi:hypothetical protein
MEKFHANIAKKNNRNLQNAYKREIESSNKIRRSKQDENISNDSNINKLLYSSFFLIMLLYLIFN